MIRMNSILLSTNLLILFFGIIKAIYKMTNYFVRTPSDVLWEDLLKKSKLGDFIFIRNIPMENSIVDFYCEEKKVAILLNSSRSKVDNAILKRALWLNGIFVIRISDIEILNDIREVEKFLIDKLSEFEKLKMEDKPESL